MIVYDKLFYVLRNVGRLYLLHCISSPTLAKLSKNENVDISTINKICEFLKCQPGDIMEYRPDRD